MLKEYLVRVCSKYRNNCVYSLCPARDLCSLFPVNFEKVGEPLLLLAVRDYLRIYCDGHDKCEKCLCDKVCVRHLADKDPSDFPDMPVELLIEFLQEIFGKEEEKPEEPEEDQFDIPELTAQEVWEFMKEYILNADEINMGIYPEMIGQVNAKSFFEVYSPEEAIRRWRMYKEEEQKKEFQKYEIILVDGKKYIFKEYTDEKRRIHVIGYNKEYGSVLNQLLFVDGHHIQGTGEIMPLEDFFE